MSEEMREDFENAIEDLSEEDKEDGTTAPTIGAKDLTPEDKETESEGQEIAAEEGEKKPTESTEKTKPPASWKPEERETWATLPPSAKAAVVRRERQIDETLRVSAAARDFAGQFERMAAPFQHFITAAGSTPLQAVENMFRTAAVLTAAPAGQKAAEVANLIVHYGVDLTTLDEMLTAKLKGSQPKADAYMGHIDAKLKPVMSFMQRMEQMERAQHQSLQSSVSSEWEAFSQENEFAEDLREDIADLLEVSARRGVNMSLQDAYTRATMLHPTISKIADSRKKVGESAQLTAAARRAKQAAASISSDAPSRDSGGEEREDNIRSAISASIASLGTRR